MRKHLLGLLFALTLAPAFAQVPPPVPALPDAERRTSYSITATTCTCSVGFALYGDSTNIDAWVEVWISNVRYLSTDSSHGWSLSSVTGSLATIARPITNAVLTFNAAQTGVVQIVGARRPIRASQFNENQGVPARNLNQVLTDIVAQNRETWDRTNDVTGRALLTKPGDTIGQLPSAAARASTVLGFDSSGNPQVLNPNLGLGTVVGPVSTVDGHVAVFSGTSGQIIRDGGSGIGTVLSVGLSLPGIFNVTGSPVTNTGTLTAALASQTANFVWAGPTTGSAASPTFRALVGADIPLPGASSLGGIFSKAAVTSNWLRSLGTDGALTASQPAFTDISGVASAAQLPTPTASTLGGVQSYAAVTNQWINTISTSGVPSSTQPAFSNISGSVASTQMPALTGDVTSSAGAVATTIAANAVTNAKSAQMAAATFKGNPTASLANAQDFTIQGLTARGTPDAANDKVPIFDNATGTIKYVTPNQIAAAAVAGVSSLNGLSGGLSIAAGTGISVSAAGTNITISSSSGGSYMLSHASGSWACTAPDGSNVSVVGSTTSGLQECINAMQTNKTGALRAICPDTATPIIASTVVTFGPSAGYLYDLRGCSFTTTSTGSGVVIDTMGQGSEISWSAGYFHCQITGGAGNYCVDIKPNTADPVNSGKVSAQSRISLPYIVTDNGACASGSIVAILHINPNAQTTSAFVNNILSVSGLDGNAALKCAATGMLVDPPTVAGNGVAQNIITLGLVANFTTRGIDNGAGTAVVHSTQPLATNEWHVAVNIGATGVTDMIRTSGFRDLWFITSLSINAGTCTNTLNLVGGGTVGTPTGASDNSFYSNQIDATSGCTNAIVNWASTYRNSFEGPGTITGTYTATLSCGSGTLTSASAPSRFRIAGRLAYFEIPITITTTGTCAGSLIATLPQPSAAEVVVAGKSIVTGAIQSGLISASGTTISIVNAAGAYGGSSGDRITVSGVYEIQ